MWWLFLPIVAALPAVCPLWGLARSAADHLGPGLACAVVEMWMPSRNVQIRDASSLRVAYCYCPDLFFIGMHEVQ